MKKAQFTKGDLIVVGDYPVPLKVVDVSPYASSPMAKWHDSWEYKVRLSHPDETGNRFRWVDGTDIMGVVKYQPVVISNVTRHMELVDTLPVYGVVRDYLETLPKGKMVDGCKVVEVLKEIVENLALTIEGSITEGREAGAKLEELLR